MPFLQKTLNLEIDFSLKFTDEIFQISENLTYKMTVSRLNQCLSFLLSNYQNFCALSIFIRRKYAKYIVFFTWNGRNFMKMIHKINLKSSMNHYVKQYINLVFLMLYIFIHILKSCKYEEKMLISTLLKGNLIAIIKSYTTFLWSSMILIYIF